MKLIKNAIVYKAILPNADLLRLHLAEAPLGEMTSLSVNNSGFVPNDTTKELVTEFPGGLSFDFRYDEKIIPASMVKTEVKKRSAEIEEAQGYRPGRKQMREIRENILAGLAAVALVRTTAVTCFYDTENQFLIVPVSSRTMADRTISKLIHAVGSVETRTINISDIKLGLTTRLKAWLEGEEDIFGVLDPCDEVNLNRGGDKVNVKLASLDSHRDGLIEAIGSEFYVDALRFDHGGTSFKLTSSFHFKSITFPAVQSEPQEDPIGTWMHEASVQLLQFSEIVTNLCDLLGYKAPDADEKQAA